MKKFGTIIREHRLALYKANPTYSLRQFAVRAGMSPTYLSKIERDEMDPPADDKIIRLAHMLDLSADFLFAAAGRMHPDVFQIYLEYPEAIARLLRAINTRQMGVRKIHDLTAKIFWRTGA
jgi:transcriptional regulator with XRE-family HTH domain